MIKVCHIVNHITGKADGVYAHLKMIISLTDKNKYQHYLIFQGGEKVEREMSEMGVSVFVCKSLNKKYSVKAFYEIYKFIKENNISIIHTHLIKPYAIAGFLNIFLRRKFIFNYHGLFIYNNKYYNLLEKLFYAAIHILIDLFKVVDVVLVPSKRSKQQLLEETNLFPEPAVYYNSYLFDSANKIDEMLLEKIIEIKKNNLIIAAVARLEKQKKIDRTIETFNVVFKKRGNISLMIFGDGELKNQLEEYSLSLGLTKNVYFFDFVQNISAYFKFFDILLFTSEWEGMPVTMWEALANKVPVIAPDVGGFREILEENNCGIIFKTGDLKDAELKLRMLIENEPLRKLLGENGNKVIKQKYNAENFKNQIENIYTNLSKQ